MGTLVKEDFGRPNRENTMVTVSTNWHSHSPVHILVLFIFYSFEEVGQTVLLLSRECDMDLMINWMMMVLHLL